MKIQVFLLAVLLATVVVNAKMLRIIGEDGVKEIEGVEGVPDLGDDSRDGQVDKGQWIEEDGSLDTGANPIRDGEVEAGVRLEKIALREGQLE